MKKLLFFIYPYLLLFAIVGLSVINSTAATVSLRNDSTESTDTLWFLIRVDDIYFRSDTYQGTYMPHNFKDFQRAIEPFGAKITWGVIPHRLIEPLNQSGHMTRDLRKSIQRGHEVSVHGYRHICPLDCENSPWGHEMYCPTRNRNFTFQEQANLIQNSLDLLADSLELAPTSFIAPGHHLDETTYQVLLHFDFFAVSNYRHGTEGSYPRKISPGLTDVPVHNEFTWALTPSGYDHALNQAIADVKKRGEADGYYNLMLHDPFTRPGYHDGLVIDWMVELLDSLTAHYGDRLQFTTLSQAALRFRSSDVETDNRYVLKPQHPVLYQNYPNPFNPKTRISYSIPEPAHVKLEVFNLLGQKKAQLVNETRSGGKHEVTFDASGFSSGLFIYRFEANGYVKTRPMLFLK